MDIASKKLPLVLIIVLLGVLVGQYLYTDSAGGRFIDSQTCEIYIKDSQINGKKYLNEFDSKCLDLKNLAP